jgi:hypothetical protein
VDPNEVTQRIRFFSDCAFTVTGLYVKPEGVTVTPVDDKRQMWLVNIGVGAKIKEVSADFDGLVLPASGVCKITLMALREVGTPVPLAQGAGEQLRSRQRLTRDLVQNNSAILFFGMPWHVLSFRIELGQPCIAEFLPTLYGAPGQKFTPDPRTPGSYIINDGAGAMESYLSLLLNQPQNVPEGNEGCAVSLFAATDPKKTAEKTAAPPLP